MTQEQQMSVVRPFSTKDVRAAIKGLNGEGSLGPDGIPTFFYRDFEDLVRPNVMATVEEFVK